MITTILLIILFFLLANLIKRALFINNDENFKSDSKWPDWLIKDAEEWNRKNPTKKSKYRTA